MEWLGWCRIRPAAWRSSLPLPEQPKLGADARRLLDDPVLVEALDRIEARLLETWRGSEALDEAGREACFRMTWAIREFRAELRRMLGDSRMLERERERQRANQ